MPRYGSDALAMIQKAAAGGTVLTALNTAGEPPAKVDGIQGLVQLRDARALFDQQMAALDARGAGAWGGPDFSRREDARGGSARRV